MKPNWLEGAIDAARKAAEEPGLHHVVILHDDWCDHLKGCGPCNCNPEIRSIGHAELRDMQIRSN
jgi:hypothetical protein